MKKARALKTVFLILFAALIIVPIITMDFMGGQYSTSEQRYLAGFPLSVNQEGNIDISKSGVQSWVSDNIGQRNNLLKLYVNFKYKVLGQSTSDKVMFGKDGWMFYTPDNNIEIALGEYPMTEENLKNIAYNQQAISDYYKAQGVTYILMITPSKVSIYSEYLPMSSQTVAETPADIVTKYLRANTDVIVYNAKEALIEAKNDGADALFFKQDTHWNQRGSYYAYKGLHKVLVDNGVIDDEPIDVEFTDYEYVGEFSAMLGDAELLSPEVYPIPNGNFHSVISNSGELLERVNQMETQKGLLGFEANLYTNDNVQNGRLQIYGDSQTNIGLCLPLYLSEHFNTTVKYAIRNPSTEVDNIVNPDTVIFQCSERYITRYLPYPGEVPYLIDESDIPDEVENYQEMGYNGMWIDNVNFADFNSGSYAHNEIPRSAYQDSNTVSLWGWAADFKVNKPLSALYLKIGDNILQCQYGIERTSVSDYFQNENLKMTGFSVIIPKKYFESVNSIEFIQVGNDGTYRFENVNYSLVG